MLNHLTIALQDVFQPLAILHKPSPWQFSSLSISLSPLNAKPNANKEGGGGGSTNRMTGVFSPMIPLLATQRFTLGDNQTAATKKGSKRYTGQVVFVL
jgi:hypothetical protein